MAADDATWRRRAGIYITIFTSEHLPKYLTQVGGGSDVTIERNYYGPWLVVLGQVYTRGIVSGFLNVSRFITTWMFGFVKCLRKLIHQD